MSAVDIEQVLRAAVDSGAVPGVVAGVARGDDVSVWCAGEATVGGPPMQRDTLFRISSMTKPVTAAVVLALAEEGLVDLDEPVDGLLPELAHRRVLRSPDAALTDTVPARRPILIRDLLTFTGGFGMQGAMLLATPPWPVVTAAADLCTLASPIPGTALDPDAWMARLGELPLMTQPGERWLYNTGSHVLGVLCSRVTGAPLPEVFSEVLLGPLGMNDTGFVAAAPTRLATAYSRSEDGWSVVDPADGQWLAEPAFPDGAAGLLSTVDDMLTFGRSLLRGGGRVLCAASVAAMTSDQLTAEQRAAVWPGFDLLSGRGWGHGVSVLADGACTWDGGLGSTWLIDPAADLAVVVLTQRAADATGMPAVLADVVAAARATTTP